MKNLAGNDVSIFLFRFVLRKNAISFVLNESIAEDMYPEIEDQIQPLVQACSETLLRYREQCRGVTIMDGNILVDNCFEVMLERGLGRYFVKREKQNLFNDANEIANFLMDVMDRRTKEIEQGNYPGPQKVVNKIQRTVATSEGLEALGERQKQLTKFPWYSSEKPSLNRLTPDDLPCGVVARRGYDHRGHCIAFEHEILGELGRVVVAFIENDKTLMVTELSKENPETLNEKQKVLEEISATIEAALISVPERL